MKALKKIGKEMRKLNPDVAKREREKKAAKKEQKKLAGMTTEERLIHAQTKALESIADSCQAEAARDRMVRPSTMIG